MIFRSKRAASACFIVLAALVAVALLPAGHAQVIPMRGFQGDLSDTHDTFLSVDLNGDGKADMLYSRPGSGTAGAYLSHGDGTFHYVSYADGGTPQSGFAGDLRDTHDTFVALDLNGDGKSDFIQYRPGGGDTIRCLSKGDGAVDCNYLSQGGTDYFNFGDSMTNSNTRIVAMNRYGRSSEFLVYTPGGGSAGIYVPQAGSSNLQSINLTGNSTPSRATGWQETMTAGDEHIVPLDANGDGSPDLLVFSPRAGTVHLYINNGSNGFTLHTLAIPGKNLNGFTGNSQDNNARAIALDLDGDGKQDFLWWQAGSKTVIGFLSNGDGTVTAVNYQANGGMANGFQDNDNSSADTAVALDADADGKQDFFWYSPGNNVATLYFSGVGGALSGISYGSYLSASHGNGVMLPLNFLGQAAPGFVSYVPGSGSNGGTPVFNAYTLRNTDRQSSLFGQLNTFDFHTYPGSFLSDLNWSLGNVPLKEIVMPGTHDSSMHDMFTGELDYRETQLGDYLHQLAYGARAFDFRMGYLTQTGDFSFEDPGGKNYALDTFASPGTPDFSMTGHGNTATGYMTRDVLNTLETWLVQNPNEVIVLYMVQSITGGAGDFSPAFKDVLQGTTYPNMIYTQQMACGTVPCKNYNVQPQNMTINQLQHMGPMPNGARLILLNGDSHMTGTNGIPDKTEKGWQWGNSAGSQVGYCENDVVLPILGTVHFGGASFPEGEIDCINYGALDPALPAGSTALASERPLYQAADAAPGFTPMVAALTDFGYYLEPFTALESPIELADGPLGFNKGSDSYDLNNQLSGGAWNDLALNTVSIDGLGGDGESVVPLLIKRNRQTWVDMHFFNNRADNPAGALSIGANGDIWAAGAGHSIVIYKYNPASGAWVSKITGMPNVKRLATDPQGGVWVVDGSAGVASPTGRLIHYDANGQNANVTTSVVQDVAVGKNGSVWAMGVDGSIFKVSAPTDGSADIGSVPTQYGSRLAVDNMGRPWVIDNNGSIQKFNGSGWQQVSGSKGREIVAGADGSIFIKGYNTPSIGRYNVQINGFDFLLMDAAHIAVEPGGQPWAIRQGTGTVYKGSLDQM